MSVGEGVEDFQAGERVV
ncbi:hypothetical protein [Gluconobacter frateurii]